MRTQPTGSGVYKAQKVTLCLPPRPDKHSKSRVDMYPGDEARCYDNNMRRELWNNITQTEKRRQKQYRHDRNDCDSANERS